MSARENVTVSKRNDRRKRNRENKRKAKAEQKEEKKEKIEAVKANSDAMTVETEEIADEFKAIFERF